MSNVSLERYYFVLYDGALTLKMSKMALNAFCDKTLHVHVYQTYCIQLHVHVGECNIWVFDSCNIHLHVAECNIWVFDSCNIHIAECNISGIPLKSANIIKVLLLVQYRGRCRVLKIIIFITIFFNQAEQPQLVTVFTQGGIDLSEHWYQSNFNVSTADGYSVIFEGVVGSGTHGDLAIDDVGYTLGSCNGFGEFLYYIYMYM